MIHPASAISQPQTGPYPLRKSILSLLGALTIWGLASWFIARANFLLRADDLIRHETQFTNLSAQDLADGFRRNLNYLSGIPDLLSRNQDVIRAVAMYAGQIPSSSAYNAKKTRWTADPALNRLDRYLDRAKNDLNVDLIYVVNAAGDCIAAGNWSTHGSSIGTNFSERIYFSANKLGHRGMQYAVGKTTHLPGLFFSSPIFINKHFMGAVVAKINVADLSSLIEQTDAFIVDSNGVIILSQNNDLEMHALPGAHLWHMSSTDKRNIYQRNDFTEIHITGWRNEDFPTLQRVENETVPHIISSSEISGYGFNAYVQLELPEFLELEQSRTGLFEFTFVAGSLLILLLAGLFFYLRNISRANKEIELQANYDALTRLPNRRLFSDRLEQEIKRSFRANRDLAILLTDLDGFKEVNDAHGHHMGDSLLKEAANRISCCIRETDTVARLGGDEFIVILPELDELTTVDRISQKILDRLAEPFILHRESVYISASIGIALYPNDAIDMKSLLKHADQAMYAAKRAGRNRYNYFIPILEEAAQQRRKLIKDLGDAITKQDLQVYYQPIVELRTGHIRKAEALIRWQHPTMGFISPAEFIPLAESSGMITKLGNWVFRKAARQVGHWRNLYDPEFQISVNKSPLQFKNMKPSEDEAWVDRLAELGMTGDAICVEITEGVLLDAEDYVLEKLLDYSQSGIQVAMDDFGTGYSSLAYLRKFDIDYLKIDKTFVRDLATNKSDSALCEAMITMAHKLGLKVIAEGVETKQQCDILTELGCDYAQGYFYSRPIPAQDFEKLLSENHYRPAVATV